MKKIKYFCCVCLATALLSGCGAKVDECLNEGQILYSGTTKNTLNGAGYTLYAQTKELSFLLNEDTTAFKVVQNKDGYEWLSHGKDADADETAPLTLTYVTPGGQIETANVIAGAVEKGQYICEPIENGAKVTYSVGDFAQRLKIPYALPEARMEALRAQSDDDFLMEKFNSMFYLIDIKNYTEKEKERYLDLYPRLEQEPLYILLDSIAANPTLSKSLASILGELGYTNEQFEKDSVYFSREQLEEITTEPKFRIQIVYTLKKDQLFVSVPETEIQMTPEYPLIQVDILKYFGCPSESDEGYFLLPDGSGSLMDFYNGKGDRQPYATQIYGIDRATAPKEIVNRGKQAYLPVYGVKNGDHGMFAVIEGAEAVSQINAYPGGERSAPYVYASFNLREYYKATVNAKNANDYFVIMQNQRCASDISLRYIFLRDDESGLKGMADRYQNILFGEKHRLAVSSPGLTLETVGMIQKKAQFLGFTYNKKVVMTTFEQTKNIAGEIREKGISGLAVKLSGWFNGGYRHSYAGKLRVDEELGKEKEFIELSEYLRALQIDFYPDVDFQYTYATGISDGFSPKKDSVVLLNRSLGRNLPYNFASFERDAALKSVEYINNPKAVENAVAGFTKAYDAYKIPCLSLRGTGANVHADFNETNPLDRQGAVASLQRHLSGISGKYSLMTSGANAYILPYISCCTDIPLTSDMMDNTDTTVPFLQMVLSGYVRYTGPCLNLSGNWRKDFLRMASVAADAFYIVTAQNHMEIRDSDNTFLYCSDFSHLKDQIFDMLRQYQKDFAGLSGEKITDYTEPIPNVLRTTFAGGKTVTVNLTGGDAVLDGMTIAAESYMVQ